MSETNPVLELFIVKPFHNYAFDNQVAVSNPLISAIIVYGQLIRTNPARLQATQHEHQDTFYTKHTVTGENMDTYKEQLIMERDRLIVYLKERQAALKTAPAGHLRISHCKNYCQYFECDDKNEERKYISVKQESYIRSLAQKEYDEKICRILDKRIRKLTSFLDGGRYEEIYNLYAGLPDGKKKFIVPVELTPDEYAQHWMNEEYRAKPFLESDVSNYYNSLGNRMRSKSEIIIADTLTTMNIPYRYECALLLEDGRVIYPDFTILRKSDRKIVYLEHLGMMDDTQYSINAVDRISLYEKNGFYLGEDLFLTFETSRKQIDRRVLQEMFKHWFL